MPRWQRRLWAMVNDPSATGYSYAEAAAILSHLGFVLASGGQGSHRKWRLRCADGRLVIVGLVESRELKPYLVRDMVHALRTHDLLPPASDGLDD